MHLSSEDAKRMWECPLSRIWAKPVQNCRGDTCPLWRKRTRLVTDPGVRDAVTALARESGEKPPYKAAFAAVASNPEAHGLGPETGFCGLGGPI